MNQNAMTFDQFAAHTQALAEQIHTSGFRPAMIIAIARGGWGSRRGCCPHTLT
ncbi:MAG: hypothetical protein M3O22_03660 [Pseudomonadota bacterium]|nr:hypothetical protein [Pseudomonadota bacterium]